MTQIIKTVDFTDLGICSKAVECYGKVVTAWIFYDTTTNPSYNEMRVCFGWISHTAPTLKSSTTLTLTPFTPTAP